MAALRYQPGPAARDPPSRPAGLHTMRRRWDDTRPFLPWLHAILRYKLTDAMRRRERERRVRVDLSAEAWDALMDETPPQDSAMTADSLTLALNALPAGQRHVVEAGAIDGASGRDTAARLTNQGRA